MRDCHLKHIYHGDIKAENVLVTSWAWVLLTDFSASFKPTCLPEDNPADFSFYFDISGRRACYLAPERFISANEARSKHKPLNWAMDIFSVGCVLAELFLETPIFNLSQLFNYKAGEYDPSDTLLSRIEDKDVREMITHMIQIDPESRFSAEEYLEFWRGKVFPEFFNSFLHQYMALVTDPGAGKMLLTSEETNTGESDDRLSRIYHDYDKIAYFLGYPQKPTQDLLSPIPSIHNVFPLHVDLPYSRTVLQPSTRSSQAEGTLLFLNVVTSSLRSTARSTARLQACDLLLAFSEQIKDDARLDRALPFVVALLDDRSDIVRIAALRTLAQLITLVASISPVNAFAFPEYIIPKLNDVFHVRRMRKLGISVRISLAQCLAPLAEAAAKFLDSIEALKAEGTFPANETNLEENLTTATYQYFYDSARGDLVRFFESHVKVLLTDEDASVRQALLGSIASLCIFFGSAKTNDVILTHLNTYLNDRDWRLKQAFFESIVGVAIYVGSNNLEEFVLPLMVLALADVEESVVSSVLRSFATMAALGLFQRRTLWSLIDLVVRFTMHPNTWIRENSSDFIASAAKYSSAADRQCILLPLLSPFLTLPPAAFDQAGILDSLKKALSRDVYSIAFQWVGSAPDSQFWKHIRTNVDALRKTNSLTAISARNLTSSSLAKISKTKSDQQWMSRLRAAGMGKDDDMKLLALCEFIIRVAGRRHTTDDDNSHGSYNKQQRLNELDVPVNTFQIDAQESYSATQQDDPVEEVTQEHRPQTISDALLDASATMSSPKEAITDSALEHHSLRSANTLQAHHSSSASTAQVGPVTTRTLTDKPSIDSSISSANNTHTSNASKGQRNSAINLLQRNTLSGKSTPETSTSAANAFGKLEQEKLRESSDNGLTAGRSRKTTETSLRHRYFVDGGYSGRDPNVLRLLESVAHTTGFHHLYELGPEVVPIEKRLSNQLGSEISASASRLPSGDVVASFSEHAGPIVRVLTSPDHLFFITASEDGSIKLWDTGRLERNIAHRSRQTYKLAARAKVTTVCFIRNTHVFAAAGSDGTVHLVRADCNEPAVGPVKYGRLRLIRQWTLPQLQDAYVVWMEHFQDRTSSLLVVATSTCHILAYDLRTMTVIYDLENPVRHGVPSCFCTSGQGRHWLLIGTSHGVLDLWDLRFQIRLKSFAFPGRNAITRILRKSAQPTEDSNTQQRLSDAELVFVSGGSGQADVTAWDLQEFKCKEVWRTTQSSDLHSTGHEESTDVDKGRNHLKPSQLHMDAYILQSPEKVEKSPRAEVEPLRLRNTDGGSSSDTLGKSFRSILQGQFLDIAGKVPSITARREPSSYLIAAGPGNSLRHWTLRKASETRNCAITTLPSVDETFVPTSFERIGARDGIVVNEEVPLSSDASKTKSVDRRSTTGKSKNITKSNERRDESVPSNRASARSKQSVQNQQDRRETDRGQGKLQQPLTRSHLDVVTDVAVLERPYRMIVSVDRSGTILVFA